MTLPQYLLVRIFQESVDTFYKSISASTVKHCLWIIERFSLVSKMIKYEVVSKLVVDLTVMDNFEINYMRKLQGLGVNFNLKLNLCKQTYVPNLYSKANITYLMVSEMDGLDYQFWRQECKGLLKSLSLSKYMESVEYLFSDEKSPLLEFEDSLEEIKTYVVKKKNTALKWVYDISFSVLSKLKKLYKLSLNSPSDSISLKSLESLPRHLQVLLISNFSIPVETLVELLSCQNSSLKSLELNNNKITEQTPPIIWNNEVRCRVHKSMFQALSLNQTLQTFYVTDNSREMALIDLVSLLNQNTTLQSLKIYIRHTHPLPDSLPIPVVTNQTLKIFDSDRGVLNTIESIWKQPNSLEHLFIRKENIHISNFETLKSIDIDSDSTNLEVFVNSNTITKITNLKKLIWWGNVEPNSLHSIMDKLHVKHIELTGVFDNFSVACELINLNHFHLRKLTVSSVVDIDSLQLKKALENNWYITSLKIPIITKNREGNIYLKNLCGIISLEKSQITKLLIEYPVKDFVLSDIEIQLFKNAIRDNNYKLKVLVTGYEKCRDINKILIENYIYNKL
ncbi:hypothetical protein DLAC_06842 [Tieghemostelium lacteum]|uniref:Uncharacterized protein n=1 Tax=Tieghemostelium lacteum TaxID=361077 RepID=A0A151ZDI1_TIELA|nr:hypothetical protein DLAC_06842 [Tieghemostelium lacteum]|eukprot:KYQ92016.1 hypothetical protein DLAC_06842 [Tieghemostelium lacteum]